MTDRLLTADDLIAAKKHDTFHSEVISGRAGGVAGGAAINYATNAVTNQTQKTLTKTVDDIDWTYKGLFANTVEFTKSTDYAVDGDGVAWVYIGSTPYPFSVTGITPNETDYKQIVVFDKNEIGQAVTKGQEQVIDANVYPKSSDDNITESDSIAESVSKVRINNRLYTIIDVTTGNEVVGVSGVVGTIDMVNLTIVIDSITYDLRKFYVSDTNIRVETINDSIGSAYLKTLSDINAGLPISFSSFCRKDKISGLLSGVSEYDCYSDLNDMLNSGASDCYIAKGIYQFSAPLIAPDGVSIKGAGSLRYLTVGGAVLLPGAGFTTMLTPTFDTADSVGLTMGTSSLASNFSLRPINYANIAYYDVDYLENSGNTPVGLKLGRGAQAWGMSVYAFSDKNIVISNACELVGCFSSHSPYGYYSDGTDSRLIDCVGMFNMQAGFEGNNYVNILGGRWEWNARFGAILGGDSTCNAALFDRNGKAGLLLGERGWGQSVSGCRFTRNGCGGNGSSGRWGFSVPGHDSYLDVDAEESAHIQIDFDHSVNITGCSFRGGQSDNSDGAAGPAYVYTSTTPAGATLTNGVNIAGNIGDGSDDGVPGFYGKNAYATASGFPCGGTDTKLSEFINKECKRMGTNGVAAKMLFSTGVSSSESVSTIDVDVLISTSGKFQLWLANSSTAGLYDIFFYNDAINNISCEVVGVGTMSPTGRITSVAIAANSSDSRYNTVTVNFDASYFVKAGIIESI